MKITDLSILKNNEKIKGSSKQKEELKENKNISYEDEYSNNSTQEKIGYNILKSNIDEDLLKDVMERTEKARGLIQDLVGDMLKRQMGIEDSNISLDDLIKKFKDRINELGDEGFTVDEIAQKEAEKLIGPGGEWSPEKVSDRIVDFSIAVFGGDKSKIEIIRDAINRGFGEAEKAWGSKLPDITNETRELIDEKLDKWVNGEEENLSEDE